MDHLRRRRDAGHTHPTLFPPAVPCNQRLDRSRLLEERRIQAYDASLLRAIFHAVEHFSYHTGQIVYVVKMLRDEDLRFYNL